MANNPTYFAHVIYYVGSTELNTCNTTMALNCSTANPAPAYVEYQNGMYVTGTGTMPNPNTTGAVGGLLVTLANGQTALIDILGEITDTTDCNYLNSKLEAFNKLCNCHDCEAGQTITPEYNYVYPAPVVAQMNCYKVEQLNCSIGGQYGEVALFLNHFTGKYVDYRFEESVGTSNFYKVCSYKDLTILSNNNFVVTEYDSSTTPSTYTPTLTNSSTAMDTLIDTLVCINSYSITNAPFATILQNGDTITFNATWQASIVGSSYTFDFQPPSIPGVSFAGNVGTITDIAQFTGVIPVVYHYSADEAFTATITAICSNSAVNDVILNITYP